MAKRKKDPTRLGLRLYPGEDNDLIEWLESLETQQYGQKTLAIKTALRQGIGRGATTPSTDLDLNQIRAVVEAGVQSGFLQALTRQGATIIQTTPAPAQEESSLLTHMVSGLMLEEDEE